MAAVSFPPKIITFHHKTDPDVPFPERAHILLPKGVGYDFKEKMWTIDTSQLDSKQLSARQVVVLIDYLIKGESPETHFLDFSEAQNEKIANEKRRNETIRAAVQSFKGKLNLVGWHIWSEGSGPLKYEGSISDAGLRIKEIFRSGIHCTIRPICLIPFDGKEIFPPSGKTHLDLTTRCLAYFLEKVGGSNPVASEEGKRA